MKSIKNVLLASAMVILSANVFAGTAVYGDYGVHHDSKIITTQTVDTKEAAYSLGLEKSNQLKSESGSELSTELAPFLASSIERNSITLDDNTFITVKESLNAQGDTAYSGLVNVTYSYSQAN
ncbi:MAG: hypothetical protein ACJAZP_003194 [Psychromonas sp.]|jgi:hypothetical protein|uniref:DUF3316 domain-containing protein n=1 Tax=Psychromonas sp. TaxID=1884585 RepID=UPI0039E41B26